MLGKIDQEVAFVEKALRLRAQRQEILAANIANADTPHYKARDIDFAAALRSAMGVSAGALGLARTHAAHLAGDKGGAVRGTVLYRSVLQPSLDGNTVDPDVERAHFTENVLHYQFLLERARSTFQSMRTALEANR